MSQGQSPKLRIPYPNPDDPVTNYPAIAKPAAERIDRAIQRAAAATDAATMYTTSSGAWVAVDTVNMRASVTVLAEDAGLVDIEVLLALGGVQINLGTLHISVWRNGGAVFGERLILAPIGGGSPWPAALHLRDRKPAAGAYSYDVYWVVAGGGTATLHQYGSQSVITASVVPATP